MCSSKIGAPTPVGKVRPVLTVVPGAADADDPRRDGGASLIDELVREGARRMLAEALQAEVDDYIARFAGERDENGRRLVVRNGSHQPREVLTRPARSRWSRRGSTTGAPTPRPGERARFSSAILPPWCRKTPKITEVLPLLYLHGLSTRATSCPRWASSSAPRPGLSAPVITKLTETWKAEQRGFAARDLSRCGLRLPVGRRDPRQHPAGGAQAVPAGHDRGARRRAQGARRARRRLPRVDRVVGGPAARLRPARDACAGARDRATARSGSGARCGRCSPGTREQRCWFHKIANVLGALPKSAHPGAKKALAEIWNAEDRQHALDAVSRVQGRLRSEVRQGRREDHRRSRGAAGVLRLPRRALDPPAHHEPDRVDLRHRPAPHEDHPRARITRGRAGDGVQADRGRPGPLARGQRPTPGRARPRRRHCSSTASSSNDPTKPLNPKPPKRSSSTGLDDCSNVLRTFEITGVAKVLTICRTVDEALHDRDGGAR